MCFEYKHNIVDWEDAYRLAKNYYKTYGNLKIIQKNRIRMLEKQEWYGVLQIEQVKRRIM